jgi:hypothetical protein
MEVAMDYREMLKDGRLEKGEIAQLCELFVAGVPITKLSIIFNMHNDKIYGYLMQYYFGQVPKVFQETVVIQSKINDEDHFSSG